MFEWPSLAQRRSQLLLAGDRALRGLLALFAGLVFFADTRTMRVERPVPAAAVPDGLGALQEAGIGPGSGIGSGEGAGCGGTGRGSTSVMKPLSAFR